ncbi:KxYKxGKxW signal peptide domain-containing protein [Weissella cibaria]|uniref:KxYKxGKxW signal peptide domain-containing protein n=1 Tax=Weissella cibaria TaxID=137591 RepID=UPI0028800A58|nr:KxYKxGKxW signal peptide domain-containing protein [Weissella cibaria]
MNFKSLHTADFESKTHYKMYKDGKQWMFAGIMAIALGGWYCCAFTTSISRYH